MKIRGVIISAFVTLVVISAYGFINKSTTNDANNFNAQIDSTNKELSDFGINGGIAVNYYNGAVSQFVFSDDNSQTNKELFYMVQRKSGRPISEENVANAKSLGDIISNYPSSWMDEYISVEITTIVGGKEYTKVGRSERLTKEQKQIVNIVKMGDQVAVRIKYKSKNTITGDLENHEMNINYTVVPLVEAEFVGGYEHMITYLKKGSLKEINAKQFKHLPQPTISFVVNEDGKTESVKLIDTSRDDEVDKLLLKLVKNMPTWIPAKTKGAIPVKQEFVLMIGQDGC